MNKKWTIWVYASIANHFSALATANEVPLFVEGQFRDTKDLSLFAEQNILGLAFYQEDANTYTMELNVAIILHETMKENPNMYTIPRLIGIFLEGFTSVPIKTYGETVIRQLTCLQVESGAIKVTNLGQINPKDQHQVTLMTCEYRVTFNEGD